MEDNYRSVQNLVVPDDEGLVSEAVLAREEDGLPTLGNILRISPVK